MSQNTDTEFTDSKFYSNFKTSTDSQIGEIRFVINIVNLFNFSPTQASSVLAIIYLILSYISFEDVSRCVHLLSCNRSFHLYCHGNFKYPASRDHNYSDSVVEI